MSIDDFRILLRRFYENNYRDMPWRKSDDGEFDPYAITVSEIMLQQTQVERVIPKFEAFITAFPTLEDLAAASLQDVLKFWSGLGYNRRAKYLHDFAKTISNSGDTFPTTVEALSAHKGIGPNTAAAILVYSYNQPQVFIETNIRTVYINTFFAERSEVSDAEILEKVAMTLDRNNPREFYWALMDYGTYLKKQGKGNLAKSASHARQSTFEGSLRQIRGKVIKHLTNKDAITIADLATAINDERLELVLKQLEGEQLITISDNRISIAS